MTLQLQYVDQSPERGLVIIAIQQPEDQTAAGPHDLTRAFCISVMGFLSLVEDVPPPSLLPPVSPPVASAPPPVLVVSSTVSDGDKKQSPGRRV